MSRDFDASRYCDQCGGSYRLNGRVGAVVDRGVNLLEMFPQFRGFVFRASSIDFGIINSESGSLESLSAMKDWQSLVVDHDADTR